ncbi:DNA polymerase III subunit epsilon [Acinetobacter sp. DSM 11652]|uniref:DNA polymerase III subunit epsilon n=1 Tax=Acinetobacter sp. DSM 11652 TaxID=346222 RepID=UPI0008D820A1|nr:DNA polymerase III subunit epsilon [Acinetobacter sp. DSM 11652]SEL74163.1 ribonuclease HI / DNA polymerase-3 subunit epsilon [Acinetobacter sp. DSM 11652]
MSEITLYVDGACRGNPGLGGWGAYIITKDTEHKICGGEPDTTNNRMELTAAIEGIKFCPVDAKLIIWTDSNYVKRGITEWISGWKKKNWKDVKNPDLWQTLDQVCQGRDIEWNWIKGHAGHPGNEMADQLANQGADQTAEQFKNSLQANDKKKQSEDWLLNDPFGLDLNDQDEEVEIDLAENDDQAEYRTDEVTSNSSDIIKDIIKTVDAQDLNSESVDQSFPQLAEKSHPHIVVTPARLNLQGPRQLILDTETTGFYYQDTDRIIEVGAIEMINRKLTGSSIHIYINPKKPVGESEAIHGISDDFLKDKPIFEEIAAELYKYLKGAEIIAHNATFDMNFLDMEFKRAGFGTLSEVCAVTDTLAMAKAKHPGQKNSLDALVKRYEVPQRDRTFHGALLDAEILSDVYLAMTGGQVSFDIDALSAHDHHSETGQNQYQKIEVDLPIIYASDEELAAHQKWIEDYQEKNGEPCLFAK